MEDPSIMVKSFSNFLPEVSLKNISIRLLFILLLFNSTALAKPKIVVSTKPIASLVAMLIADEAEVQVIANSNSCPHHYHAKPSDLALVKNANIVIYIDEQFDGFASNLMKNSKKIIKISKFNSLKLITNNGHNNWHFWLDLSNIKILLNEFSKILIQEFPHLEQNIKSNLYTSLELIRGLATIKNSILTNIEEIILLDESVEYYFSGINFSKFYKSNQKSLRYFDELKKTIGDSKSKCLVLGIEQNAEFYKKFSTNIIQIDSEIWQSSINLKDLFYSEYIRITRQLEQCKRSSQRKI